MSSDTGLGWWLRWSRICLQCGRPRFDPWVGKIPWRENGNPLQYSCLGNPMDGGARWATVHGVAKSQRWQSDFTLNFHFHALEKEMATHSSILAWRIPRMAEPGGLPSMGSHRVGHDWSNLVVVVVESILKSRDITLPANVCLVKTIIFPAAM